MSRSRHPKCPAGRGCATCGDDSYARRCRDRAAQAADAREVEPLLGEIYDRPDDGECYCLLCDPDFYDREVLRRRMLVESPTFPIAERVLAQAGIKVIPATSPAGRGPSSVDRTQGARP